MNLKTPQELIDVAEPAPGKRCGIYFLILNEKIVYVGQSIHVEARIADHSKNKEFDSFTVIPFEPESLDFMEAVYIKAINPPLNRTMPFDHKYSKPEKYIQFVNPSSQEKIRDRIDSLPKLNIYGIEYVKDTDYTACLFENYDAQ